uniref:Aquaporin n=1 Tax=Hyaloperonospora arabidopsidis (strain Emoy2) TaxID=559515 RepID=M4BD99_HYAAE
MNPSNKPEDQYFGSHEPDIKAATEVSKPYQVKSPLLRECLAEFIGTMVLIMFGDGVVAQVKLGGGNHGDYLSINLCWGLGVLFGIHASGGVSGGHLNPAVTTTLFLYGRIERRKVIPYIIAQVLGAFVAAFFVWAIYYPLLDPVSLDRESTRSIFATYPYNDDVSIGTCFLTEVVGTALLLGGIFALGDELNEPASPYTKPGAVALLVTGIGMAFGLNTGYAINPARDFGPRFFSLCAGWGSDVFTLRDYYFWVPIVGPILGGAIGGGIYIGLVEYHHPREYHYPPDRRSHV